MSSNFLSDFINGAIESSGNDFRDNYDASRFGPRTRSSAGPSRWIKDSIYYFLNGLNLKRESRVKIQVNKAVTAIVQHINDYEWLYKNLEDEESRKLLVQVQLYRALGETYIKLPLNNKNYWSKLEAIEKLMAGAETIDLGFMDWKACRIDLNSMGYPLELFLRPQGVLTQLILQQYRCHIADMVIEVSEGDVVIDGGGCHGETALYFASKAGSSGKVFSFEFMPENLSIFRRNMELNPAAAERVNLIEKPLWGRSGEKLYIKGSGPSTRVSHRALEPGAKQIETLSIDDLIREKNLPKVDFIKMDIEGAELQALKGAEECIRKFRPKLAISIYHKPEDFWTIPKYIADLGMEYRFALRHFTIHKEETVLFAY